MERVNGCVVRTAFYIIARESEHAKRSALDDYILESKDCKIEN